MPFVWRASFIEIFFYQDIKGSLGRPAETRIYPRVYANRIFDAVDRDAAVCKSRFNQALRATSRR